MTLSMPMTASMKDRYRAQYGQNWRSEFLKHLLERCTTRPGRVKAD
jgi:hypothetical protein